jgi:GNAT superfamily N-acetyltransferase
MSVLFRPAVAGDRAALIELMRRASLAIEADRAHLLAHPEAVDLPAEQIADGRVLVAEQDGVLVGFSALFEAQDGSCELDGLFVEPRRQRQGLGRRLLDAAEAMARREGADAIRVIANDAALDFYQACGFEVVGQAETQFATAPLMRKVLAP